MAEISSWQTGFMYQMHPLMVPKPNLSENAQNDPAVMFWEIWLDWFAPEFKVARLFHDTVVRGNKRDARGL